MAPGDARLCQEESGAAERAEEVLGHALRPCQKVYRKESPLRRPTPADSPVMGCFCSARAVIYPAPGVE